MIEFEVIQNPVLPIVTLIVLLCCLTAITFIVVLLGCGFSPEEILEAERG